VRRLLLIVSLLATLSGVAHGSTGKHERWVAVKALGAGALVVVLPQNQAGPDECRVLSVDDSALICVAEGSVNGVRLVFPRSALSRVWVVEPAPERHIGRWIAFGVSMALIATASVGGAIDGAIVGVAVALGWIVWYEDSNPMGPPKLPQMRQRLIYRTAAP